ncbi:MAG TPA: prolyl oligopeptidase family serine peptidase [Verrucomicrobiae bacterium]|nr:prolyl oligopeptidase family serine peptidase [Verrucomicrobiae bacterium]
MRGAIGDEYPVFPFAAQGFAVLCHTLFPLDWARAAREADGGLPQQFGPADADMRLIQDGVDAAIDELDRRGIIDTRRIAITGLSAGGQSVEYALIHMPRLTAAISSGSHLTTATHYMAYPTGREEFRRAGFESSASPRYDTRSISRNASRIRAPLLMNLSEEDFETESVVSLRAAGRAVEMFVYPDENHIKNQPAHRLAIYNRNIDWMNFWLRGVESGLSGDTSQYARWRALREEHCRQTAEDPPWFCRQARAS